MTDLHFKWATELDYSAVKGLAAELAERLHMTRSDVAYSDYLAWCVGRDAPMKLLLMFGGTQCFGMASWTTMFELYSGEKRAYLADFCITSDARRHGMGSTLFSRMRAWLQEQDVDKIGWDVWLHNHEAHAFYASTGACRDQDAVAYVLALSGPSSSSCTDERATGLSNCLSGDRTCV